MSSCDDKYKYRSYRSDPEECEARRIENLLFHNDDIREVRGFDLTEGPDDTITFGPVRTDELKLEGETPDPYRTMAVPAKLLGVDPAEGYVSDGLYIQKADVFHDQDICITGLKETIAKQSEEIEYLKEMIKKYQQL